MDSSALNQAIFDMHHQGRIRGHYFSHFEDGTLRQRRMTIGGRELTSFASCSYLGLEFEPELIASAQDAYQRYGTQSSFSRGYLSSPLYRELEEDLFPQIFGTDGVVVTTSTSAAHMIAIPALINEKDAVVCDHQVHRSVDDAITLQCARSGAKKIVIKHGKLDRALETVRTLAPFHRHVWFACDGIYSMYGDYLPTEFLKQLMDIAPNVRLYIDDAHGMSWKGTYGRGHLLDRLPINHQVVVATSLSKSFAAGGGAIITHDRQLAEQARLVGGPYCFSGPLRPGDLGALVASAKFHLSPELIERQETLQSLVTLANTLCRELSIPIVVENEVPFVFIALGSAQAVFLMAEGLMQDGYHASVSGFPAVPSSRGGLRVALSALHTKDDVRGLFQSIATHLPRVLRETNTSVDELESAFRDSRPTFTSDTLPGPNWDEVRQRILHTPQSLELTTEVHHAIDDLDQDGWDQRLANEGCISTASLSMLEQAFPGDSALPEYAWSMRYITIRGPNGEVVAQAPITGCLSKDDFVMQASVSRALEFERLSNPYLFTSKVVSTGTMLSEGRHMYLTDGPHRHQALCALVDALTREMKESQSQVAMIRDIPRDEHDVREILMERGFFPMTMPDMFVGKCDVDEATWLRKLSTRKYRKVVRKQIHASDIWRTRITTGSELTEQDLEWARELYMNVARKNLELNVFPLPMSVFRGFAQSPAWEFIFLYLPAENGGPSDGRPVAVGISHTPGEAYRPLIAGIDYRYIWPTEDRDVSTYRQLLLRAVRRARTLGKVTIHLGMGAPREKRRFGAKRQPVSAFIRSEDSYASTQLLEFAQQHA